MRYTRRAYYAFALLFFIGTYTYTKSPRVTIVVVIDGCGYHAIQKIKPFCKGGIKKLYDSGVIYENAYFPHACPTTAPGHAALNTGAFAKDHGIVGNKWFDKHTKTSVACDDDTADRAAVFGKTGFQPYGKSCHLAQVDGVSDEIVRAHQDHAPKKVVALSLKSRAAIHTAGKRGTAFWFDQKTGIFTSSKAYVASLPEWLNNFNAQEMTKTSEYTWDKAYPNDDDAYNFHDITNYDHIIAQPMVGKKYHNASNHGKDIYSMFYRTPRAIEKLFSCAHHYLEHHTKNESNTDLLLWISISSSDKIGHIFGPQSLEYIDTLYHIDKQLGQFMEHVNKTYSANNTTFIVTADHGSTPIPELLHAQGTNTAHRINANTLVDELNDHIEKLFSVKRIVSHVKLPFIHLNHGESEKLPPRIKKQILHEIKTYMLKNPAIQNAWTHQELLRSSYNPHELEYYYKNQLYPSRSGDIMMKVRPYTYISNYAYGTGHLTPYEYNTHVPLVVYQPNTYQKKTIYDRVSMLQVAPTLSYLFGVPNPTACTVNMLPGLHN